MNNCSFCDIVANKLPSSQVYRDDRCTVFMDIKPVNPGHMLIIPNQHASFLAELDVEIGAQMFRVAQGLGQALRRCGIKCEGVNFFLADGKAAMQEVFHVHLHVFPRYEGDGFGLTFGPDYSHRPGRSTLDEIAQKIKSALS